MKKFELVMEDKKVWCGVTLYRIRACVEISRFGVKPGDLGGYIQKAENLSNEGDAWVSGDAQVSGNAQVYGNAWVYGDAWVSGDAQVSGNAQVYGNAWVYGDAQVSGNAQVYGNAWVYGDAQVYGNARVSGDAQVSGNAQVYGNAWVSGNAQVSGRFQVLNLLGLRWSITLDSRKGAGFGCKHKSMKEWTEAEAANNGLSAPLYKEYRKLVWQMKRVQRMERELAGQIEPKVRSGVAAVKGEGKNENSL